MAPSRRISNGRSPLVNQQRQITTFFSPNKTSTSPSSASLAVSKQKLKPDPANPNPCPCPSPSSTPTTTPPTKQKKPLLVIGPSTNLSPPTPSPHVLKTPDSGKKLYGEEVVGKKIKIYWPLDKCWYEGCVKSFDMLSCKHLVQYDDAEEEALDLLKEKIEWVEEVPKSFRRLRRNSVPENVVLDVEENTEEGSIGDDSTDEDWGKNVGKEMVEDDDSEEMDFDDDDEEEVKSMRVSNSRNNGSRKRKTLEQEKQGSDKKIKGGENVHKSVSKASLGDNGIKLVEPVNNAEREHAPHIFDNKLTGDVADRFGAREAEKFRFLGEGRRDAKRRLPGDVNYDPRTLYLPPDFLKGLSGGQRQWWEFKSKHMDKVLFFKMGKFYELFEMDAHIGAKELDLQYMKGEQPHCGFPEKNFAMNLEKLARKGYRVLVVEQTETPEQLELRRKEKGSKDKVVKREICAVVTKGTLTEGEMLSNSPDASYLMTVTESQTLGDQEEGIVVGVCLVDVSTSRFMLGQFGDDSERSSLCSLLSELRPVEIIKPANFLSPETETVLMRNTRSPLVNSLVPVLEFWDSEKTIVEVRNIYKQLNDQTTLGSGSDVAEGSECLPDVLAELVSAGKNGSCAISAFGGCLFYLRQAFLDESLLRFAKFELLPCSGFCDILQKPYMVIDAPALENLEMFENSRNGGSSGTLYAQLNHCVTAFGKRLLKNWLARPLYHAGSIRERQDAIAALKGVNLPSTLEFRKDLSKLPDMERLLARLFASSEANGRNANKVILYEDAAKKQLQEFLATLRGCVVMIQACSSLSAILENVECTLLHHLLTPGKGLPDIYSVLKHFKDAFDWPEADRSGRIIPHEGVDMEHDSACKQIKEIESSLVKHLKEQRKVLGDASINYVTVGKELYLLEVPESLRGNVPRDYELRSSKKGFFRYWTPKIKKLLGELSQAEAEKETKLKSILQQLIGQFCVHHIEWRQLISVTAELDVLISLAVASDYYEGNVCRPVILPSSCSSQFPSLCAKSLGHPVLRSDTLGKGTFVPNDVIIGGSEHASFILLTGPNMGGKSTLLRQVCMAVILAQLGADVPAESFQLSPVDRIFVRMGAKDHIMAGQSTFFTELSETAAMLSSATHNSLVALDELGRGTSTSDGQAIAESVLEHFISRVKCRGLFSTHYHRLSVDYQKDPKVSLCHMACQVGKGVGVEEVTFLYRLTPGACPKSYGVNVARLAGLPDPLLQKAAVMSREFEAIYGKHRQESECKLSEKGHDDQMSDFFQDLACIVANLSRHEMCESMGIRQLTELQQKARLLLQGN
ncbi:DNA mismatch repair protein MSH6 [Macadamia integrifolia]|uniref:DNA mismatch repair protein MSH6 n=1 Tax=Macadamia integrifolia TaxID=60698 RepID=UPI001C52D161|nr:DNA mismatch repair protein MSH6 [Macadamia integrifolia]XP_042476036.1 DNA mismatch repair protein MSH6 [Macadamia integrifolia]XP_042476037.1 DNA mismatch repair protein MSH6 [Macadamia integrifolia]